MRRLGPFNPSTGEPDSSLPWQDGNPATGQEGSIPSHRHWTHAMEEIVHVIEQAGLQPTASDLTQLWQAIQIAIEQGPGGGVGGAYVTQAAALTNLPIFPEVLTQDAKLVLSAGTGEVVIAADQNFVHRGVFRHSTSDWDLAARTFATAPSKTYHTRWTPLGGFALKDLADGDYNPGALNEWDPAFDTRHDDILFHRVVTDSANVATIKALVNRDRLRKSFNAGQQFTRTTRTADGLWIAPFDPFVLDWARTPDVSMAPSRAGDAGVLSVIPEEPAIRWTDTHNDGTGSAAASLTRYELRPVVTIDMNQASQPFTMTVELNGMALA